MLVEPLCVVSPDEAFKKLRHLPMPFIFSGGRNNHQRRYSFMSADPFATVMADRGGVTIEARGVRRFIQKDPFEALSEIIEELQIDGRSCDGPFPFNSGAAGYFSYDLKDVIEPGRFKKKADWAGMPLCVVGFYDPLFVYDHHEFRGYIVSGSNDVERCELFRDAIAGAKKPEIPAESTAFEKTGLFYSTHTKDEYIAATVRAQEYIAAGDVYQINLSQRLSIPFGGDAFSLHSGLMRSSPAPFSSFMDLGEFQIISNSPERLLKVSGGYAEISPIKGTRPRGETS